MSNLRLLERVKQAGNKQQKKMHYHTLGKSDLKISEIGFGCMSLGEDQQANITLLHDALEQGITYFDTADMYQKGMNEIFVGNAFRDRREQVVLATKVGNQWRSEGSSWDWNPTKPYILQSVEESLKRLQTDYIDLYQLHGGTISDPIDETIEAFELLKQQGKIRFYGISSIRPNVIRAYVEKSNIVSVMMQYSLLDRRPEESCLELLQQHTIGVLARGSLAKGLLVNKAAENYLNYTPEEVKKAAQAIGAVSNQDRNQTATAMRFVLQHPAVTSAVVGIRTSQQLQDVIQLPQTPLLTPEEMQQLKNAVPVNTYQEHR